MPQPFDLLADTSHDGDVARRLTLPYLNHAAVMYASGYATAADIDTAMRFGCGYPSGPLTVIDELGASRVGNALHALHAQSNDDLHDPAPVLAEMAEAGNTFKGQGDADTQPDTGSHRAISTVGVVGTGTMATGIAEVFARAGFDVVYVGRSDEKTGAVQARIVKNLDKAVARGKLDENEKSSVIDHLTSAIDRAALGDADIVIEAIAEDVDVKRELFADLDAICKPGAILATTTSSLSIQECADATQRPDDVIGMHFFNPATAMKLVEVVTTDATSTEVDTTVKMLCAQIGKHPVSCSDRAGFIVNALLFPYLNDAVKWHEDSGMDPAEVDRIMKATGPPMGPFELLDVVGNDVALAIQRTLVDTFGHAGWEPAATLISTVDAGRLGRKTGAGFHEYA